MSKRRVGRGSKYSDEFKRRLVAESQADGVSVPMVSRRHGVPTSRIYSWRSDDRFQPDGSDDAGFMPVEISGGDHDAVPMLPEARPTASSRIEITLENGRKLSVSDGVDAGFVLELARGLAA
ncbi:transposase [Salipiger marinus]|jgi:transposase|uniref:Transposase n=5 Tax=root TaxID=1 RepID=A0A1W2DLB0_9RHOB|nr:MULTISPECIES: transposase [Rhodobacterales]AYE84718.1 transposase [Sulfitobacter sp. D7]AYE84847.1 transposase [Sulfitobacter sp. D7]AYE85271.1 transposase [Sulfitobacter sp. D7]AYE88141.1 transposase [Sulfitobacter sp. D7]MBO9456895.1 transposase [Paracoccus sp. R12_2]